MRLQVRSERWMKPESVPNELLTAARLENCWTLAMAAEKANVSIEAYSRWEYGTQVPRLSSLKLLCDAFGKTAEELGFGFLIKKTPLAEEQQDTMEQRETASAGFVTLTREEAALVSPLLHWFKGDATMTDEAKRETLRRLLKAALGTAAAASFFVIDSSDPDPEPKERLVAAGARSSMMNADTLHHYYQMQEACWGLNNNGEMGAADRVLTGFLPNMVALAPYQPEAALIAAQGLRLGSLIRAHKLKIAEMVPLCLQSVEFARQAKSADALSAALNGLAVAYKYANRPEDSFKAYQEAIYYSDQASPLLRSRVYAGAAAAFAQRRRYKEADFYIHFAYETFPDRPENDPNFLSADNGIYMLAYYEGLIYLERGEPKEADRAFESYMYHPSGMIVPERNRLEILNHRGRAAIQARNLERYAQCFEEGMKGASALKSKKRYDEAVSIFHNEVPGSWRKEPKIKQAREQFQL